MNAGVARRLVRPAGPPRADVVVALSLGVATTVLVGVTAQSLGFTRDEGYYFKAAELYWGWFRELFTHPSLALTAAGIDQHWSYNHEHPALLKTLFALSYGAREVLGLPVQVHNALRFPAWCVAGFTTVLVYAFARSLLPRRAAVIAALMWVAMPRVFWHMHLSCFDVGVAGAHVALVLAYWRWRRTVRGALAVGVVFGLCAAVKHNVLPVPAILVLHWVLVEAKGSRRIPLAFFSMAFVGPLVYLAHWPWLWPHPLERFGAYVAYHLSHENYPILYFGDLLTHPPFPFAFPFVMSAVTIPVPILCALVLGFCLAVAVVVRLAVRRMSRGATKGEAELTMVPLGDVSRDPSASAALMLLLNALYPFVLIALPTTPIFGGTKHWMNGLPFLCILGAWALEEAARRLEVRRAFAALAVFVVLPGVIISARTWPYGLGAYNELIGFARGAATVGMQRTFWGYEPMAALPFINDKTPRGGRIHFGDTNHDDWRMYRRDHLLREDIDFSGTVRGAAVASVQPQGEFKEQWMDVWNEWKDRTPDVVLGPEGVPFLTVTLHE